MAPKVAALRSLFGIGMMLALLLTSAAPAAASRSSASTAAQGVHAVGIGTSYNRFGLQKEVFAFAPYWALSQESTWNYEVMSTVAYFGLDVNWDGTWNQSTSGWRGYFSSDLVDMIARAHRAGDRAVLVIKSGGTASLNDIVTVPSETQMVIDNTIGAIANRGFDGVNIDFEGQGPSATYPNIQTGMTNFVTQMSAQVHQRWPSALVTIDTYTGSASWSGGLFKIDDLAPVVDAMFIMAYDMPFDNMPGQAGPTAPMTGWTYNDTTSISEYLTKAPASKIILGVPWYGYRFTTNSSAQYAATSGATAESYANGLQDLVCAHPSVSWDSTAQSNWAAWYSPASNDPCGHNAGSWLELYYDDPQSLGIKYNLANSSGIRGVGVWALGYDGGAPELWSELSTYFSCPASISLPTAEATTEFDVVLTAGSCSVAYYEVQQYDSTLGQGWFGLANVTPVSGSGTARAQGFPGYTYQFRARSHSTAGVVSAWTQVSTAVTANATYSHPFKGLYTLDSYGGINAVGSPPLAASAYWRGWKIARAAAALAGSMPQSGAVVDGYGGLHFYGAPITLAGSAYWAGWDIGRDLAFLPDGSGGYVLDAFGGLHPFSVNGKPMPPATAIDSYWPYWDIARKVAIFSDGTGGYVLDGFGGIHPFGIGGPRPTSVQLSGYWPNWDIIHAIALITGTHSGYVLDGYGNVHPFTPSGQAMPPNLAASAYWGGWDIARAVWLLPGSTLSSPGGYVMDGYGGLHPFGNAPAPLPGPYWAGMDIGRSLTGY